MIRRILSILSALLLLSQFSCCVLADEEEVTTIRSSYWTDNVLYSFVNFSQEKPEELEVSLFVNNYQQEQKANPKPFNDTGAAVHYLLLVDTSSSMSKYAYHLSAFAQSLLKNGSNLDVSIATMGTDFRVAATDLTTWNEVQSVLRRLNYQNDGSDICGGTAKALEYLGEKTCRAGDVSSLVVITDGEPWYTNSQAVELEREEQAAKAAVSMMEAYPEIIVNTLCFQNWEENAFAALSSGKGLHLSANTATDAGKIGTAFSDYMDSLYTVTFPLKGYEGTEMIEGSVQLAVENSWFSLGRIRNVDMHPALESGDAIALPPVDESEEAPTQGTESTEPTETAEATEPATETTIPADTVQESTAMDTTPPAEAQADGAEGNPVSLLMVGMVIAIAATVAAVLVIAGILAKKKKAEEFSIRMRMEILCGEAVSKKEIYYLTNELLIGTGKQCDIVIRDPNAASVNTRIFKQGQMIYIEDMGSPQGTVLNGMRIFSSNRLRSEDEITIGSTVLRVLF